jgi:hypothetical protein
MAILDATFQLSDGGATRSRQEYLRLMITDAKLTDVFIANPQPSTDDAGTQATVVADLYVQGTITGKPVDETAHVRDTWVQRGGEWTLVKRAVLSRTPGPPAVTPNGRL